MNSAALAAGVAAIHDSEHMQAAVAHNERWLPWATDACRALGLQVLPSVGNFVLLRFPGGGPMADAAYAALRAEGFLLRPVGAYGLGECLRMTIGDEEANRGVVAALGRFMKEGHGAA